MLPPDMFHYLPNLKKIILDYNLLVILPKLEDNVGDQTSLAKPSHSSVREQCVLQKLNHFSASNNKIMEFPISLFLKYKQYTG